MADALGCVWPEERSYVTVPVVDAYRTERARILGDFGLKLADLRNPRTTSQKNLGDRAGLHRNEINLLEGGKREPKLLTLLILADALGVEPVKLLEGLPAPQERKPKRKGKDRIATRKGDSVR